MLNNNLYTELDSFIVIVFVVLDNTVLNAYTLIYYTNHLNNYT